MTIPSFSVHSVPVNSVDTVVVIGLSGDSDAPQIQSVGSHSHLASVAKLLQASSKLERLTKTIAASGTSVVALLGLGSTQPSEHKLRLAAGAAGRKMSSAKEIEFQIPKTKLSQSLKAPFSVHIDLTAISLRLEQKRPLASTFESLQMLR